MQKIDRMSPRIPSGNRHAAVGRTSCGDGLPPLSTHARRRAQQRGISSKAMDVVLDYGSERHAHGCVKVYLDRRARVAMEHDLGPDALRQIRDRLGIYVVTGDDRIVTAAHRCRRIRR